MDNKDFDNWCKKKSLIHETENDPPYFNEREVWWSSLGINIGVEIDGKHELFIRPVVILRKFNKYMALVVPVTTQGALNKYHFDVSGEDQKIYKTRLSQIRTISSKRLFRKINTIAETDYFALLDKVSKMVKGDL